jgi:hypothetical protein
MGGVGKGSRQIWNVDSLHADIQRGAREKVRNFGAAWSGALKLLRLP